MIALDTNLLVRYLVDDDPAQARRAAAVVERAVARDEPLYVSQIVVCETVWVLSAGYGFGRDAVASTLENLFRARHLQHEDLDSLRRALEAYRAGRGDFADYLIRERARAAGCDHVVTFDRELLREDGFRAP